MMPAPEARSCAITAKSPSISRSAERGRRFVHHDDARGTREHFGDLDELLLPDREIGDGNLEGHSQAEFVEDRGRTPRRGGCVEETASRRLGAQRDVRNRTELRDERKLLVDHADSELLRALGRIDRNRRTIDEDLARVGTQRAGKDFHQGRFTGAVLTDQNEHFAAAQRERHVGESAHAGKTLPDAAHLEQRRHAYGDDFVKAPTGILTTAGGCLPPKYPLMTSIVDEPIFAGYWIASPYISPAAIALRASGVAS